MGVNEDQGGPTGVVLDNMENQRSDNGQGRVGTGPVRAGVGALLRAAPQLRPRLEKLLWRGFYEAASLRRRDVGASLMNYGFAPLDGPDAEPGAGEDRFGRQLYAVVAGAADLAGKDVLDVGCGRGGGSAAVFERFGPRSLTGLDLAKSAIERCRARYGRAGLTFVAGDAEALPFPDETFDAVLSVESSHCYPDVLGFLREVHRVLRPGGVLLMADFRRTLSGPPAPGDAQRQIGDIDTLRRQIADAGLRTVEETEITPNVVDALSQCTPELRARIEGGVPKPLQRYALEFAGIEGTAMYRAFAGGELIYLRFVLQRA